MSRSPTYTPHSRYTRMPFYQPLITLISSAKNQSPAKTTENFWNVHLIDAGGPGTHPTLGGRGTFGVYDFKMQGLRAADAAAVFMFECNDTDVTTTPPSAP